MVTSPERQRVLFILGAGHCGSTLLSLLLNGHPDCVAVSELGALKDCIRDHDPVLAEPAWQEAARCFEQRTHLRFADLDLYHPSVKTFLRWSRERVTEWTRPRAALLECLSQVTGKPWIIDASKSWHQLYLMDRSGLFDLRVVHLVRDARGIVHSYTKKYKVVRYGLSKWLKSNAGAMALQPRFGDRWMRVRYEDLVTDPAATLAQICSLMGLAYDPQMLRYRDHTWLGLGGNRMAKSTDSTIRLDEKWRREMPKRDQRIVNLVGGALNRYYGYGA
ncbi:MAG TPA: sulfotransferase [Kofleriaceae bacterium]|nr:sulfotransferase [Kofleriaceae bacterium]